MSCKPRIESLREGEGILLPFEICGRLRSLVRGFRFVRIFLIQYHGYGKSIRVSVDRLLVMNSQFRDLREPGDLIRGQHIAHAHK